MKKIILVCLLVLVLVLVGCGKKIECNKPYILVGSECCLDKDDNGICDRDEVKEEPKVEAKEEPKEESNCGNDVCDEGEDCEICQKDCGKCFSLSDLQADINKVIDWKTVLTKDKEDSVSEFYIYTDLRARLLGKYPAGSEGTKPTEAYNKVLPKRYILVARIKDKKDYLKDDKEFYQYVTNNKDYLLAPITQGRDTFQEEFKTGEIPSLMLRAEQAWKSSGGIKEYSYVDSEKTSEKVYFNNITKIETVGNKIVENLHVSVDEYKVTYQLVGLSYTENRKFSGINYLHTISVYCSPSLVITLYPAKDYSKTDYDSSDIDETRFLNDIRYDRKNMLVDATALVSMCEQRYEFTYLRYR